ncbi:hypothetical protein, partial [uncultured Cyclobacterium sp.]|uniref:hypothetical protein n=1 Tax=uncultured Cyclobacterium sp. TaxID=453820 RepID=UPI0030ECFF0F
FYRIFQQALFIVVSIFYWNEWTNVFTENYLFPFYSFQELGGPKQFLASTSSYGFSYLTITAFCFVSIVLKNKTLCLISILLSLIAFFLLFN